MSEEGRMSVTDNDLRIGFLIAAQMIPWQESLRQVQMLEELGYESVWLADHFHNRIRESDPFYDPWIIHGALATHTKRIRLGTSVTNFIYRNPALLAKQVHAVDALSNGRVILGLGTGVYPEDHAMTGTNFWMPQERVDRFREAVHIVDQMLGEDITTFEGDYYWVEDSILRPATVQKPRPPIMIAAMGKKMLKITAQYADCWNTLSWSTQNLQTKQPPTSDEAYQEVKREAGLLEEYCHELGRDPGEIRRSLYAAWTPGAPIDSVNAFQDFIGKYREIGITDFIFYWMTGEYLELMRARSMLCVWDTQMVERAAAALSTLHG